MKKARLFFFVSILVCISLSCSLGEATPMVDILPTEIQSAAQPPADMPPADQPSGDLPPAGQLPTAMTNSTRITGLSIVPPSIAGGQFSATVSFSIQGTGDGFNCFFPVGGVPFYNFLSSPESEVGKTSETFTFSDSEPGPHTLTCTNYSQTSRQTAEFTVENVNHIPVIQNPGFESGFDPWKELPAAIQYGGQSVDENVVTHSGGHSRKLFLRYGGSYIFQRVPADPALPLNSTITLTVLVKMPQDGSLSNKVFTLEMVVGDDAGHTQTVNLDWHYAILGWGALEVHLKNTDFPVTWIEVRAMTNKGDGLYKDFDKIVYVDDFYLDVILP
jgi:hypothetical protein